MITRKSIERMGTGITRMKQAMENAGLEVPVFAIDRNFRVTFKRDFPLNGGKIGTEKDYDRIHPTDKSAFVTICKRL